MGTYKCESLKGNSAAKKTLCEAVKVEKSADAGKCIVTANGGSLCCKVAVTKGKKSKCGHCRAERVRCCLRCFADVRCVPHFRVLHLCRWIFWHILFTKYSHT